MKSPSLNRVNKQYKEALEHVQELANVYYDDAQLLRFAQVLVNVAHKKKEPFKLTSNAALCATIAHLKGKVLTEAMVKSNLLRVIANWDFIDEGIEIPPWDGTRCSTDVVFIGVARQKTEGSSQPKLYIRVKLKTGLCAGIITGVSVPVSKVGYFLDHIAGVAHSHCNVEEIAGMQAQLVVGFAGGSLQIFDWYCTNAHKKENRKLTNARGDAAKCVRSQPCNVCKATVNECGLAVWLPKKGKPCQKQESTSQDSE